MNLLQEVTSSIPNSEVGFIEIEVSPKTAPYLVTSSKGLVWVPEARDKIRAAFRQSISLSQLFKEIIEAVSLAGREFNWGNIHILNEEGLNLAISHVNSYDQGPVELLCEKNKGQKIREFLSENFPITECSWMPENCVTIVPKDRRFVGVVGKVGYRTLVGAVHNASRGIGIARK